MIRRLGRRSITKGSTSSCHSVYKSYIARVLDMKGLPAAISGNCSTVTSLPHEELWFERGRVKGNLFMNERTND
ncbi:hypothetical protein RIF29_37736 [Crotalaria pallida]|uniref:Uncharacterized protein n=1 Tax=Crotalaria pallida TaxID=3830 RepID=A0AAN9HSX9_CROPI